METLNTIFRETAIKINPDFHEHDFISHNGLLYDIIIKAMSNAVSARNSEIKRLRQIINDDIDYKAMRNYAKELEAKLGIITDSNK